MRLLFNIKIFVRLVFVFCCCAILSSCEKEEDYLASINVLVIGNSYSRDAFSYVPDVIYSVNPDVAVNLHILGIGGSNLETIYNDIVNKKKTFQSDEYNTKRRKWSSVNDSKGSDLVKGTWNLIVVQENSVVATNETATKKNVKNLVSYLRKRSPNAKIAFMINPTHPVGSTQLGDMDIDEEFRLITDVAQNLLNAGVVDCLIPCGTAIQNARHTSLNAFGDFGQLSYDGNHLQEGVPCLIEAYTAAQFIMNTCSLYGSVAYSGLIVTNSWVKDKMIPGKHGDAVRGSLYDYLLCKKCALAALDAPFSITDFSVSK